MSTSSTSAPPALTCRTSPSRFPFQLLQIRHASRMYASHCAACGMDPTHSHSPRIVWQWPRAACCLIPTPTPPPPPPPPPTPHADMQSMTKFVMIFIFMPVPASWDLGVGSGTDHYALCGPESQQLHVDVVQSCSCTPWHFKPQHYWRSQMGSIPHSGSIWQVSDFLIETDLLR